jgi:hypothetical protein
MIRNGKFFEGKVKPRGDLTVVLPVHRMLFFLGSGSHVDEVKASHHFKKK